MNPIPDLIPLCDSRPGLRSLVEVQVREPAPDFQLSTLNSQPVLDFIASTATLDRYHEIIEQVISVGGVIGVHLVGKLLFSLAVLQPPEQTNASRNRKQAYEDQTRDRKRARHGQSSRIHRKHKLDCSGSGQRRGFAFRFLAPRS